MKTDTSNKQDEALNGGAARDCPDSAGSGLIAWGLRKRDECVLKAAQPGKMVRYGNAQYKVAHQRDFPHGRMIGIYDEPPSRHVDYINPKNLTVPFQNAQAEARR